jgi:16S rRNA (guanine527-N7)-methyltransferase
MRSRPDSTSERDPDLDSRLATGAASLGISLSAERRDKLLRFLALLHKWNRAYNLSGIDDPDKMLTRHLLDSLAALPYLRAERVLDVGTGPGLPGMVLALAEPQRQWVLLDSKGKKTRFLTQARIELGADNVEVVCGRAEDYRPERRFDAVISRALGSLAVLLRLTAHLRTARAEVIALKGAYPETELAELPTADLTADVHRLSVPGLAAERHLIVLKSSVF